LLFYQFFEIKQYFFEKIVIQDNISSDHDGPPYIMFLTNIIFFVGSSPPPPPPGHPLSTEHESSNARNELREIQAKQCNKKKQATVSPINVQ